MLENKLANLQRLLSDSQEAVDDNTQVNNINAVSDSSAKKSYCRIDLGVIYIEIATFPKLRLHVKEMNLKVKRFN